MNYESQLMTKYSGSQSINLETRNPDELPFSALSNNIMKLE